MLRRPWAYKLVLVDACEQRVARDAKEPGCAALVAGAAGECFDDPSSLVVACTTGSAVGRLAGARGPGGRRRHVGPQVVCGDSVAVEKDQRPLECVAQLAEVARPRMAAQRVECVGREHWA